MAVKLWDVATSNAFNTTLNGSITDADTSITLSSVSGLQAPGVLVIDRTDGSGNVTPSAREYITYTGINASQITGVSRGVAGSSAQSHNSGAQVEEVMSITHWGDMKDFLEVSHDANGKILTSTATITTMLNASGASILGEFPVATSRFPSGASGAVWTSRGSGNSAVWAPTSGSGTGGFNALFQVPGSLPTSASDTMGQIPVPTTFTSQFINAFLRVPCSGASLFLTIKKYPSTTLGIIAMPAGATFASSASLAVTSLSAGDYLIGDINTSNNASDLSVLLRAV